MNNMYNFEGFRWFQIRAGLLIRGSFAVAQNWVKAMIYRSGNFEGLMAGIGVVLDSQLYVLIAETGLRRGAPRLHHTPTRRQTLFTSHNLMTRSRLC